MEQLRFWRHADGEQASIAAADTPFPGMHDVPGACAWMASRVGMQVRLTFTRNHSTMVSYRVTPEELRLRLHTMFLRAGPEEAAALVDFINGDGKIAGRFLDRFMTEQAAQLSLPLGASSRARGRHHDLGVLFARLNAAHFHDACRARPTWSRNRRDAKTPKRRAPLAQYVANTRLIRVDKRVDSAAVPEFYVSWIIYRAMLHELFEISAGQKRYPPEFAIVAASYPDYERCREWETHHLAAALSTRARRAARHGTRRLPQTL